MLSPCRTSLSFSHSSAWSRWQTRSGACPPVYMAGYGMLWLSMIVLLCLTAADSAFGYMGAAMYFMFALSAAGLRVATRVKLGISGDMVSDVCACCFALPWAVGQMHAEDFTKLAENKEETKEVESKLETNPVQIAL